MKKLCIALYLCCCGVICSCGSIPKGQHLLKDEMKQDIASVATNNKPAPSILSKGRPIYIEAFSGEQFLANGDIWQGGKVLLLIGHEKLSLKEMLKDHETEGGESDK